MRFYSNLCFLRALSMAKSEWERGEELFKASYFTHSAVFDFFLPSIVSIASRVALFKISNSSRYCAAKRLRWHLRWWDSLKNSFRRSNPEWVFWKHLEERVEWGRRVFNGCERWLLLTLWTTDGIYRGLDCSFSLSSSSLMRRRLTHHWNCFQLPISIEICNFGVMFRFSGAQEIKFRFRLMMVWNFIQKLLQPSTRFSASRLKLLKDATIKIDSVEGIKFTLNAVCQSTRTQPSPFTLNSLCLSTLSASQSHYLRANDAGPN